MWWPLLFAICVLALMSLAGIAAIVAMDELEAARRRREIGSCVDPLSEEKTRKLVDRYRQAA